uniref:histidine kinase n=1 Tax=Streptomyces sp. NBC_00093 TaxID=2975649 RepID=A0AAU2AEY9_9ACTN
MPAPQPSARPAPHGRGKGKRRAPIDRFVLEQIRSAVAPPLVICIGFLGVAVIVWRTGQVPTGYLLALVTCGPVAATVAGVFRSRTAAKAVDQAHKAQLQRVTAAAAALEKLVQFTAEELCRGGTPSVPESLPPIEAAGPADDVVALLDELQVQAADALIRVHSESRSSVLLSMNGQFARREHALLDRALELLDLVQRQTDDPDQLDTLWKLDHLVTRLRRWVESKSASAGESLRSHQQPVNVVELLRGAVQEVEYYSQVSIAASTVGVDLGLPRHVGPDLTHLLAELVENATAFCDQSAKVQVRAQQVPRGLAIEVEDRVAIPMKSADRTRYNLLLEDPDQVDVTPLVRAGKLGLLTAAKIARIHGIAVHLSENSTGGTTALVVVPNRLLVQRAAPSALPTPAAVPTPQYTSPPPPAVTPHTALAPPGVGQEGGVPPLPQRVPEDVEPEPAPLRPPSARPRFGLAAEFRDSFRSGRAPHDPQSVRPATHS